MVIQKYYCDCCNKEIVLADGFTYSHIKSSADFLIKMKPKDGWDGFNAENITDLDLCGECQGEIMKVLRMRYKEV
jgi:hypothetical protein